MIVHIFSSCIAQVNHRCQEMAMGAADGAISTQELLSEAASGLENALSVQKDAVKDWEMQVGNAVREEGRGGGRGVVGSFIMVIS